MSEKTKGLTRKDLYDAVWTEPVSRLALKCGITDVGLAKICRRSNIPLPPRGYWQQKAAGKAAPQKPPLPAIPNRHRPDAILLTMRLEDDDQAPEPERPKIHVSQNVDVLVLHPQANAAFTRLQKAKPTKDGVVKTKSLGIRVRQENLTRVVCIIDALAKEFETRGYAFGAGSEGQGHVRMEPDEVAITLTESPETGRLSLCWDGPLTGRKTWSDGARNSVERHLGHFVIAVEQAIQRLRAERLERERIAAERARLAKREAERRQAAEAERAMAKKVRSAMAAWEEAGRLRAFAIALGKAGAAGQISAPTAEEWVPFTMGLADRVDPLVPEKPVELKTCDYMSFADWHSELLAILGKTLEHRGYLVERVYNERRTPAEAAAEVDWERSFWW